MKIIKLDLLVSFYITCIVVSELMGMKTFPLAKIFGYQLNASVAILLLPIVFTINDVIVEVYGKERARSIVRSSLVIIGFVIVFTALATSIAPSTRFQSSETAYDKVFHQSLRISIASLSAFTIAEILDLVLFSRIRKKLGNRKLWLRINLSNWISQLVDTSLFMFLAFYAIDESLGQNLDFLLGLILPYWLLKCLMSVIETPLAYLSIHWLKK